MRFTVKAGEPRVVVKTRFRERTKMLPERYTTETLGNGVYKSATVECVEGAKNSALTALETWAARNAPAGTTDADATLVAKEPDGTTYHRIEWKQDDQGQN